MNLTPDQIAYIVSSIILSVLSSVGIVNRVRRKENERLESKYTEQLETNSELNKRVDALEEDARQAAIQKASLDKTIDELRGQVALLNEQLERQEARHTRERVEQEARHAEEKAALTLERDIFKDTTTREIKALQEQIKTLQLEISEVRKRNDDLERINELLEARQKECDDFEREALELRRQIKERDKKIDGLERLVKRLSGPDGPDDHTQTPPTPPSLTIADAAEKQATVDLPVTEDQDEGRKIA